MYHEDCDKFWNIMGNTYCVIGYYLQEGSSCSNNFAPYKKLFHFFSRNSVDFSVQSPRFYFTS